MASMTRIPQSKPDPDEDKNRKEHIRRQIRLIVSYIISGLMVLWIFQEFVLISLKPKAEELKYSDFKAKVSSGQIVTVTLGQSEIVGQMKNPDRNSSEKTVSFRTMFRPTSDPTLIQDLQKEGVSYSFQRSPSPISSLILSWVLPLGLIWLFWHFAAKRMKTFGGAGGIFGITKSKAVAINPAEVGVSYKDVGGADEAIAELQEIMQFLKEPEKFTTLGGRIPKGVLLVGPPGTGKTLLAKATAGEAGVPFFETSGSEFVEMFVGVGAARVRDLFEHARSVAPAIVFIDEIDAIGQSRGGGIRLGGNDEREQTLNQLLAEIDGFQTSASKPVIIMAATNRPEVLDPALLRAGRFDRQVAVGNPDLVGRQQILRIHSRNIKLAVDFDIEKAARITPGFSGADLANALNEAALLASRNGANEVSISDFETAIERVVAGLEQRSHVMSEQDRTTVAYHESGHALVAELVPHGDPISKISIIPRSRGALGHTMQMPTEDRYLFTIDELQDRIAVMLGGRAAEKLKFDIISTGASDDIMRATELAKRMVTEFGMSDRLGSVRYAGQQLRFIGNPVQQDNAISSQTREIIDEEIKRIITEQYERAKVLLKDHKAALESLAQQLLSRETVDGSIVKQALRSTLRQ
jgi:cell division protease FtsH